MGILLLYVEDDALVAMSVQEALVDAGFEVTLASKAEEGILTLEHVPNVAGVITDIRLAGKLLGWAVGHRAREITPGIPVIYTSADSHADWDANGVPNSVMIPKPFALAQVITAIAGLLNTGGATPPR